MSQNSVILGYILVFFFISQMLLFASPTVGFEVGTDMSLSESNASFIGEGGGNLAGIVISEAGDVNGDGYDDFLISATSNDVVGSRSGQVYLIFGKSTGWAMDTNLSNVDASFWPEGAYNFAGEGASGVGDVNGDGYDDFLIGAPGNSESAYRAGQTYLFFGKPTGWKMDTYLYKADASFLGEKVQDLSGGRVSGVGDVNGDGYDDFVIGAWANEDGDYQSGKAYLILGKPSGWSMDTDLSTANASFIGEGYNNELGRVISGAGDVNGDGFDDFLLGSPNNEEVDFETGKTYLVLGKSSGWKANVNISTADASFLGEGRVDRSGCSVSGAGDVNGDGYDDIIIGARGNWDGGVRAGQAYLILGKASGWKRDVSLSRANASFLGENGADYAGAGVSGAGDVNGDGYDDILIGAYGSKEGGYESGQTYLVLGKATGFGMDTDLSKADASFWGENADDKSGLLVSGAGDVNGDGYDDILIGAPMDGDNGPNAGQVYLIFPDRNTPPTAITSLDLYYPDGNYSRPMSYAYHDDMIDVRVNGTGGNASRKDLTEVVVISNETSPRGFRLRLHETNVDSNSFVGSFKISTRTHDRNHWIGTSIGENITVKSIVDPSATDSLLVTTRPVISKCPSHINITEDVAFSYQFNLSEGTAVWWEHWTNLSWIHWSTDNKTIWGTPTNLHVGSGSVNVSVHDDRGYSHNVSMNITVVNAPPQIIGMPPDTASEDVPWSFDFDSSDDDQGDITWTLLSDTSWLTIDQDSGELIGTPSNKDVGFWWVNISVDDGNGGKDRLNSNVEVVNVPDAPSIVTEDLPSATQDFPYSFTLVATDPDFGDSFTWSLESDIVWLDIDPTRGVLSGIPTNDDVGVNMLDIKVTDDYGLIGTTRLMLMVQNVNDPPLITNEDQLSASEDEEYRVAYEAIDPDSEDVLTWSFETDAMWLSFNDETAILSGTPSDEDAGLYLVNITVTDREGLTSSHLFALGVTSVNDPPVIISEIPPVKETLEDESFSLTLSAEDEEDEGVIWSDDSDLFDIRPTDGTITFIPTQSEVGDWWVNITATDSGGLTDVVSFKLVVMNVNDVPEIIQINLENGSEFKQGEVVTMSVTVNDEDRDDLTVTWTEGDRTLGTGTTLDYSELKPGKRIVKVTVSDGETTVEDEITVTITKEEESPMMGGPFVLLVILAITAVSVIRRRRKE
jgi:hypothetical protein